MSRPHTMASRPTGNYWRRAEWARLWDSTTPKERAVLKGHLLGCIWEFHRLEATRLRATPGRQELWDLAKDGRFQSQWEGELYYQTTFSPDERHASWPRAESSIFGACLTRRNRRRGKSGSPPVRDEVRLVSLHCRAVRPAAVSTLPRTPGDSPTPRMAAQRTFFLSPSSCLRLGAEGAALHKPRSTRRLKAVSDYKHKTEK